jgi:hypothetical protein
MPHPLVLAIFDNADAAAVGARAAHAAGASRDDLSVVARNHEEEGVLARRMDGTPGVELEDSAAASRLGELSGHVLAAIALVLPGIGPIVAGGPLGSALGEAAGHVAGGVASILETAGVDSETAGHWESQIEQGAVLLGVHIFGIDVEQARRALQDGGAREVVVAEWN